MPLLAVAALLAGSALASARSSPSVTSVPLPKKVREQARPTGPPPTDLPAGPAHDTAAASHGLPGWVGTVAAVAGIVLVAVLVGLLVRYLLRDGFRVRAKPLPSAAAAPVTAQARTEEVVAALDEGLTGLDDRDADPRRAVIACWVRLEQAAAAAGTPRRPGDTPTDLVARLLATHQVSGPVLDEFAGVYREARYATHVVDERMRAAAVRALGLLRAELTVGVG